MSDINVNSIDPDDSIENRLYKALDGRHSSLSLIHKPFLYTLKTIFSCSSNAFSAFSDMIFFYDIVYFVSISDANYTSHDLTKFWLSMLPSLIISTVAVLYMIVYYCKKC